MAGFSTSRAWRAGLEIDEMLGTDEVFAAHDSEGQYLIAHTAAPTWLCAPISERALRCVASGRAELRAAFSHSLTGLVERCTVRASSLEESVVRCADLTDDELPRAGLHLGPLVRCA
jgi:hypothetical protein